MSIFNDARRKYLFLLPVAFIIFNAFYFRYATIEIQRAMLQQKLTDITDEVNMHAIAIEADTSKPPQAYDLNIKAAVEYLDNLHYTYAALFVPDNDGLKRISDRNFATDFDALEYPEFVATAQTYDSGYITIGFTPEGGEYRDLLIYFRWMPLYAPPNERYLVVAGISEYSITTQIPIWVSAGQIVNTLITFGLNVWLISTLAYLGNIYEQRKGDKWRGRW